MVNVLKTIGAALYYIMMTIFMIELAVARSAMHLVSPILVTPFYALKLIVTKKYSVQEAYEESICTVNEWLYKHIDK